MSLTAASIRLVQKPSNYLRRRVLKNDRFRAGLPQCKTGNFSK